MAKVPARVAHRIEQGIKRFQPILASAKARDVGEADTVTMVTDGVFSKTVLDTLILAAGFSRDELGRAKRARNRSTKNQNCLPNLLTR